MTVQRKVLLVGWDAADWMVIRPLMERGEMPNLTSLVQRGVSGNLATIYPPLSPMLWTSIATGKRPGKHGIHGFVEPLPDGSGVRPISSLSRTAKAMWNILNQNGKRSIVTGWWPSNPAEPIDGIMVSDLYHKAGDGPKPLRMMPGSVHPPEWATRMADLRVTPMELPGEVISLFVPEYHKVDQAKDKRLHSLAKVIAETVCVHAAATEAMEHTEWDFAAVYYDSVDHFCHGFMKYHPPRLPGVPEEDFILYQHVVNNAYRYHDAMLGRLLQLAGPETNVVLLSDHGFHSDARRPAYIPAEMAGPAVEHRHFGIVCMAGPDIKRGQPLYGGVILDIAPTVLHLFGLPVGEDMDGKALVAAFEDSARFGKVATIPTWETVPGNTGQHAPDARLDTVAASEAMKQLVALGYIAPPPDDVQTQIRETVAELHYNLARAHDDERRYDLSIPLYDEMLTLDPEDHRVYEHLFHARLSSNRKAEARVLLDTYDALCARRAPEAQAELERLRAEMSEEEQSAEQQDEDEAGEPTPEQKRKNFLRKKLAETASGFVMQRALMRFVLESQVGKPVDARSQYATLEALYAETGTRLPTVMVAQRLIRLRENRKAQELLTRALEADPDDWQVRGLLAQVQLSARRYQLAFENAVQSLALVYHQPLMHYVMGHALMGLKDYAGAEQPLLVSVSQSPGFARAHTLLSRLYGDHLQRPLDAARHFLSAENLKKKRKKKLEEKAVAEAQGKSSATPESAPRPQFPQRDGTHTPNPETDVVVVCGLPRSGTSMLMQLLVAGGVPPLTDDLRAPDEDNPRGYFEYEPATHLIKDASWVPQCRGKVVKLVLPLVPHLPPGQHYRLLMIQRDLNAVLASQEKMLSRLGRESESANLEAEKLMREYRAQEQRVRNWLESHPSIALLPLEYDAILQDPKATAQAVGKFLSRDFNIEAAIKAVDPSLKRQK